MMTREELNADRPCQHLNGKVIPCTVVISHQKCYDLLNECILDRNNWKQIAKLSEYEHAKKKAKVDLVYRQLNNRLEQIKIWLYNNLTGDLLNQALAELEVDK